MVMNQSENTTLSGTKPFILSLLCFAVFVYSAFFILMFATGIFFRGWITRVLNDYVPERNLTSSVIMIVCFAAIVLYGLSFLGALLMWKQKMKGLLIYIISCVLIIVIPYLYGIGNFITVIVFAVMTISFALFYRRLA